MSDAASVIMTGDGVRARVLTRISPPKPDEAEKYLGELKEMRPRRKGGQVGPQVEAPRMGEGAAGWTDDDQQHFEELTEAMALLARSRNAPALAERVEIEVTVAADAAPGRRELRLAGPRGLSNPMAFVVGDLRETSEPALTAHAVMQTVGAKRFGQWRRFQRREDAPGAVTLPTVLNGQIGPGECDRYAFEARQGQHLVFAVNARELSPYLADAVPGWFDAVITLSDADGRELACADHWRFHPDPVLAFEVPRDGQYVLDVRDCLYRGREDFVYRIAAGVLPFITDLFPLGGRAGAETPVTLTGWNLATASLRLPKTLAPGVHSLDALAGSALFSPCLQVAVGTLPECLEGPRAPGPGGGDQELTLPVMVNGRIANVGECDGYRFRGRAGEEVVAEVYARRLGSPLDANLTLLDAAGRPLATNDDAPDLGAGRVTHHADARLAATLPADGLYRLQVGDTQGKAGAAYTYRLRLSPPMPDFELRVTPSAVSLRRGATTAFTVHAIRRDGFDGEILLALDDVPEGFVLAGGRIPPGQERIRMTLSAPRDAAPGPVELEFQGAATVAGCRVVRRAVPAEDMMQAFAWRFLVPAERFVAFVEQGQGRSAPVRPRATPIQLPLGGTVAVPLGLTTNSPRGTLSYELSEPPEGLSLTLARTSGPGHALVLAAGPETKPGTAGNLIVSVFMERTPGDGRRGATNAPAAGPLVALRSEPPKRVFTGVLPALPFEVVAAPASH
jgi:hypothetical protein